MATTVQASRRRKIIAVACLTGVAGTIILFAAVLWAALRASSEKELAGLNSHAEQTLTRAQNILKEVQLTLGSLQSSTDKPCSSAHIFQMRDRTINTASIEEIGFFLNGYLKCSSWGKIRQTIHRAKVDFVTSDGLEITLRLTPSASLSGQMAAVGSGNYNALIAPARFVDLSVGDQTTVLFLTASNKIVARRDPVGQVSIGSQLVDIDALMKSGYLVGMSADADFKAVIIEPSHSLVLRLEKLLPTYLSVGSIIIFLFLASLYRLSVKRLSLKAELATAIINRNLFVEYQPILDLRSGECVGAEALVRWRKPDASVVRPDLFIPLAEETGLIIDITDQVIENIIEELGPILSSDKTMHIAVNVCSADLQSGRVVDFLQAKLLPTGISNNQIWLEATERGFLEVEAARSTIDRARELGHAVAIDDFGTGYSSLQYLQSLNLDAIKIDKSFVDTIGNTPETNSVILHIIKLVHALELDSVAEGVETTEQVDFLRKQGVAYAQGWLFSKPLSAGDFVEFHRCSKLKFKF